MKLKVMSKGKKTRIVEIVEKINDESLLNRVMMDVEFLTSEKDIIDDLTSTQLEELDKAIKEADSNETLSFDQLRKEMKEWSKK